MFVIDSLCLGWAVAEIIVRTITTPSLLDYFTALGLFDITGKARQRPRLSCNVVDRSTRHHLSLRLSLRNRYWNETEVCHLSHYTGLLTPSMMVDHF